MNFLRKLFPQIQQKSLTQDNNHTNDLSTTDVAYPAQIDIPKESNVLFNNENYSIDYDSAVIHSINNEENDSNKILCTLENVAPIVIHPISNSEEPNTFGINDVITSEEANMINENTGDTENSLLHIDLNKESLQNYSLSHENPKKREISILPMSKGVLLKHTSNNKEANTFENVIDDETLQNIMEFEETLNNFDKTACVNDSAGEIINLDDFDDIFDHLESIDVNSNNRNIYIKREKNTNNNRRNSEMNLNNLQNNDVITITSSTKGNNKFQTSQQEQIIIISDSEESQSSDCDGYNSSDFEFISETEANMDGFIINFKLNVKKHDNISQASSELSTFSGQYRERELDDDVENDPSPGENPSGLNKPRNEFQDRSYRDNHAIPVGDDYLGLFQGIYNPLLPACEIYFLENKSVRASAMNVQYDGMGFDKQLALRRPQPDSSEEEFADEAKECAKKILNMYPGENRKRRRRY